MQPTQNILIAGIAGQGVVFCSDILCTLLLSHKIFLKKCDSYGFAQRGGSVISQIRMDHKQIFSPIIPPKNCTHIILLHEGQRQMSQEMISPQGKIYAITQEEENFAKESAVDLQKLKNIYLLSKFLLQFDQKLLLGLELYIEKNLNKESLERNKNAIKLLHSWETHSLSKQRRP